MPSDAGGPLLLDEITYGVRDGLAEIVLNRPEVMNAISIRAGGTHDQILQALDAAENDDTVGCVLLRGEGRSFCAGADLGGSARRQTAAEHLALLEASDAFHDRIRGSTIPVIAAVHGYCLGAGVTLAASCDFVVAADDLQIGYPEGRIGLVGASAVVGIIGRQWAKFLTLTGELLDARQAQEVGLVLTVEPAAELIERATDLGQRVARMPRESILLNRLAIDAAADLAGDAAGRAAARAGDAKTVGLAASATAPDGRTFLSILASDGMEGLREAQAQQYSEPWLGSSLIDRRTEREGH